MNEGVEVWSGGVNTWECDEMGHMNVRFWSAKALEAMAGLAVQLGMPHAFSSRADTTLVVRDQHLRFLREARPGALLHAIGGVVEMGETDARLMLVLSHATGEPAATFQILVEHITSRDMRAFPWPERIRARAAQLAIDFPTFGAPRSIELRPVTTTASQDRARALGLTRIGLGVVGPDECDVFGRMRAEMFIGRVSDGVGRLFTDRTDPAAGEGPRVGGAVLEYRLLHFAWPQAGDSVELLSGFVDCDRRVRRMIHWMVDPLSGKPWGSSEAVVVSLDLDSRKIIDNPPELQAYYNAQAKVGLAL